MTALSSVLNCCLMERKGPYTSQHCVDPALSWTKFCHSGDLSFQRCHQPPHHPTSKHWCHVTLFKHDSERISSSWGRIRWCRQYLEDLNVEQQTSSKLHGRNFYSLFDKVFPLIRQEHRFVLLFAVVLSSVRIWNEENSSRGRCHYFRLARAFAVLPQWTSEDRVGYGAFGPLLVTHVLPVWKTT